MCLLHHDGNWALDGASASDFRLPPHPTQGFKHNPFSPSKCLVFPSHVLALGPSLAYHTHVGRVADLWLQNAKVRLLE